MDNAQRQKVEVDSRFDLSIRRYSKEYVEKNIPEADAQELAKLKALVDRSGSRDGIYNLLTDEENRKLTKLVGLYGDKLKS